MKANSSLALSAFGLLVLLQACGSDTPSGPPLVVAPTPAPTPTPTPAPLGNGLACGVSAMPECGRDEGPVGVWGCCTRDRNAVNGQWDAELWDAINILQREQPALFRGQQVLDRVKFISEVARITEEKYRLCVKPGGPGDEVGVKTVNGSSEQYDIYESSGRVRYPGYQVTCTPARF